MTSWPWRSLNHMRRLFYRMPRRTVWPRIALWRMIRNCPSCGRSIAFPPGTLPMSENVVPARRSYPQLASPLKSTKRNSTRLFARAGFRF